jgi:hypothetical protein
LLAKPKAGQKPKAAHKLLFSLSFLSQTSNTATNFQALGHQKKTTTTTTIQPYNNNKLPSHDNNFFPETKKNKERKTKTKTKGWREEKFHELIMKKKKKPQ